MVERVNMEGKWFQYCVHICICLIYFVLPVFGEYNEPSTHPYVDPIDRTVGKPWVNLEMTAMIQPRAEQCFHQRIKQGYSFNVNWRVQGADTNRNFRFSVRNPVGAILHITYTVLQDTYNTKIEDEGIYTICFGNEASKWNERRVSILISLIDDSRLEKYFELEEESAESLKNISFSLTSVTRALDATSRFQIMTRRNIRQDWEVLNANFAYIMYWSMAQCGVIIAAAVVQVWALRSLFNTKTLTPTERPRC